MGYKDNPLEGKVQEFLESSHGCYYIEGYDADSFFNELRLKLGETEQSFIHKPFTHLKNLYNEVLPINKDGQSIDLCQSAKKWMDDLIPVYEDGEVSAPINTKEIEEDILLEKIKNILNNEAYEKLVEVEDEILAGSNDEAKNYLSWCYNNYAIDLENVYKDYVRAKMYYDKALEINLQDAQVHNNYAILLKNHFKDYGGAREHYEKALDINPKNAEVHNNYAILLIDHYEDKEGARQHYEKALEINPQYAEAHNNYAISLIDHYKDKEGAREHYEKALEINPQYAEAHYNYANLLIENFNHRERAKEHYEKALEINPQYAEAETNYAVVLKDHFDDAETAKQHYLKAVEIKPSQKNPERDAYFGVDTPTPKRGRKRKE